MKERANTVEYHTQYKLARNTTVGASLALGGLTCYYIKNHDWLRAFLAALFCAGSGYLAYKVINDYNY